MAVRSTTIGKPIRALHVLASLDRGGAEAWLMEIVRAAGHEELKFDVCTLKGHRGAYESEFESLGGTVQRCSLGRNPWSFARRLGRVLRAGNYDVVHSHLYYFSGWVLRAAAKAGVRKRIAHVHRSTDLGGGGLARGLYTRWMRGAIDRHSTDMIAASQAAAEAFWGPGWRRDARRRVIYYGLRCGRFDGNVNSSEVRRDLNIPASAPLVLNVGRVNWHKRQYFLVEVATELSRLRNDAYFVLVGDGADRAKVEEMARDAGLSARFRFLQAGPPEVDKYFLAADVFAFPSVSEGFGVVVIEAAAAGLYVIACDIPGVREAAEAAVRKKLLPLDADAKEWSRAIDEGLSVPRIAERDRIAHLQDFPFTIAKSVESLMQVYAR